MSKQKIGVISLGCPKNQVDCEMLVYRLEQSGFQVLYDDLETADAILINTCGFIEDAKKEAIEHILYAAQLKQESSVKAVVVTGCLAQRYREEILKEIPEVDAVVGIGANDKIVEFCRKALRGEVTESFPDNCLMPMEGGRKLSTPPYMAYLRIADGCSNCCSYCAIPMIRGKFRSRKLEDILKEAEALVESGVKELVVVAQDTTRYGLDLYHELKLPALLRAICRIDGLVWVRLLYCYPDVITDELLEVMAQEEKICHYIDLPLQHADADVLARMNRRGNREGLSALIAKIRAKLPDVILRTTLITGFPGETEENFETLYDFVKEIRFDRLGCFAYSAEEDTLAAEMEDQIPEEIKNERLDAIMRLQHDIACEKCEQQLGRELVVVVEEYDEDTDSYLGRSYMDAFEIDTVVRFTSAAELSGGDFVKVHITDTDEYDLIGETLVYI